MQAAVLKAQAEIASLRKSLQQNKDRGGTSSAVQSSSVQCSAV
jgi:hypothetical protein